MKKQIYYFIPQNIRDTKTLTADHKKLLDLVIEQDKTKPNNQLFISQQHFVDRMAEEGIQCSQPTISRMLLRLNAIGFLSKGNKATLTNAAEYTVNYDIIETYDLPTNVNVVNDVNVKMDMPTTQLFTDLIAEIKSLRDEMIALREKNEALCDEMIALQQENVALRNEIKELEEILKETNPF